MHARGGACGTLRRLRYRVFAESDAAGASLPVFFSPSFGERFGFAAKSLLKPRKTSRNTLQGAQARDAIWKSSPGSILCREIGGGRTWPNKTQPSVYKPIGGNPDV